MPFPKKFTPAEKKVEKKAAHKDDAKSMEEYVAKRNAKKKKLEGF